MLDLLALLSAGICTHHRQQRSHKQNFCEGAPPWAYVHTGMGRTIDRKVDAFGERALGRLEQFHKEDRQVTLAQVAEYSTFARKNEWPEKLEVARWLLTEAKNMGLYDFTSGCKMYRHDACKALFDAFKNEEYVEVAKAVHRVGLVLQREGIEVMRCVMPPLACALDVVNSAPGLG